MLNREKELLIKKTFDDLVDAYLKRKDWRVHENSNQSYGFPSLNNYISSTILAKYTLGLYPFEIRRAHEEGTIHIHDLSCGIAGYCSGWSIMDILLQGFASSDSSCASAFPPQHFDSACGQIANFLASMGTEWAGAQAVSSFDTYLAPFVWNDKLSYEQVKQIVQNFLHEVNNNSKWGQAPFTNISFDMIPSGKLKDSCAVIGGMVIDKTYGEFQKEIDMINRAFLELMYQGDADGKAFPFPIPIYNITKVFDWDSEMSELLWKLDAKFGTPNFQNFIGSDLNPDDVRAMCCRLRLDTSQLYKRTGGLFGAGEKTGSIGVVTLNLAQLAATSPTQEDFIDRVQEYTELACRALDFKRRIITENLKNGLFPRTSKYLSSFDTYFSTVGVCGMNEAVLNLTNGTFDIATVFGKTLTENVLDVINATLVKNQEMMNQMFNLEATPAESTAYRFARVDKKRGVLKHYSGTEETPYYTNSTQLPADNEMDLWSALEHQESIQLKYTSGTIFHVYLGEIVDDWKAVRDLVYNITHNTKIRDFTLTPVFSICPEHGYIPGKHETCPYEK